MIIELERAHTPEDYGLEEACGICGERFAVEVVLATVVTETREEAGLACPECVALMGRYRPEKFPTIEEYREARYRWSVPIWASIEEATRAWEAGEPWHATLEANTVSRA